MSVCTSELNVLFKMGANINKWHVLTPRCTHSMTSQTNKINSEMHTYPKQNTNTLNQYSSQTLTQQCKLIKQAMLSKWYKTVPNINKKC